MFTEPRVGCGAAIIVDDRILLVRRKRPPEIGHWGLPGGKIDLFETAAAATEREVMEETGIAITADRLLCFVDHIDRAAGTHWTAPVFLVHAFTGSPVNREPEKHDEVAWFALDALPDQLTISTRIAVAAWRQHD
ncbi:NUDIX hydrolase [Sphingomonas desiccabilis]|uniref:NUDIX domain-containing protein n=1 Tax=Sphingomonas desiccabilis TaxID=429134 RepID=A0A4Q2IPJ6_9SPHN|nr:NUDIX domain-containing protein [Sphingomonas desiccabilis]MBB3911732.1 ADP-ribose pyrophosphatase YjhB (NUDIX family) [Sphingomonas desiccabilis]RXZ31543.1 NUDIX domain-containing protein [Sphingomonas desiccabilis]